MLTLGQTNRETKTAAEAPSDWTILGNVFNSIGLCRRRRRTETRRASGRDGGTVVAFIRGERTSVSAGNEAFAKPRTPALATYSPYQPFLRTTTLRPPVVPNALAVVVEDENRIYIPSLAPR